MPVGSQREWEQEQELHGLIPRGKGRVSQDPKGNGMVSRNSITNPKGRGEGEPESQREQEGEQGSHGLIPKEKRRVIRDPKGNRDPDPDPPGPR